MREDNTYLLEMFLLIFNNLVNAVTKVKFGFYDMLSWIFGCVKKNNVHVQSHYRSSGYLEFDRVEFVGSCQLTMMCSLKKLNLKGKELIGQLQLKEKSWSLVAGLQTYTKSIQRSD